MKSSKAIRIYTNRNRPQRADTTLTQNEALAIREHILSGKPIYSNTPVIVKNEKGEIVRKITKRTINTWYQRENAVEETGEVLKDLVIKWRQEYRESKEEERRKDLLDKAEKTLHFVQNLRTSQLKRYRTPIYSEDKDGKVIIVGYQELPVVDEHGRPVRVQNPKLLAIKQKNAEFVVERLKKEVWGSKESEGSKTVFFDLSALRRYKEEIDKENEENQ